MATNKTRIKIRHGSTTPETGTNGLLPYELGWCTSHRALYIGNNDEIRLISSETIRGIPLVSGDNIDLLVKTGIYYSDGSSVTSTLIGTLPTSTGFRLELKSGYNGNGYGTNSNYGITQFAYDSSTDIKFRKKASNSTGDFTSVPWQTIVTSTNISSYALPLSGGILTGNLAILKDNNPSLMLLNPDIDTTATTLSAPEYNTIYFRDIESRNNAFIQAGQNTNGSTFILIGARRRNTNNDANVDNTLTLRSYADKTVAVAVSHPAAWREGLSVPAMTIESYSALLPTNGTNNWIKVGTANTSYGLLPSQKGSAGSGHNYLGTSAWYWKYAYIDEIHGTLEGNATGLVDGSSTMTSAYNKAELAYSDYTWIAGWNGYELRAINKNQFALASHSHAYLPLAGGTMDNEKSITFQTTRKKENGGGWAYSPIKIVGNDSTMFFNIGVRGTADTFNYAYIGVEDYDSSSNLRIYPNGTIRAGGYAVIRDSGTTNRKIFVTTSSSVPSGAENGDIVLVKVS